MSYITEKVAYLDGLADGTEIGDDKYGKLIRGIVDVLGAIAEELEEQNESYDDMSDCIDDMSDYMEEMSRLMDGLMKGLACLEDPDDSLDDDFVEVVCPNCGETTEYEAEDLRSEDGIQCPFCNEDIEVEMTCCGCDCADCYDEDDEDDEDED